MKKQILLLVLLSLTIGIPSARGATQGKAETPTMGWSSWNTYRVNITDSLICSQADAMVRLGLKDLGYRYVNVDDGFFGGRAKDGSLLVNTAKFPRGMKAVADHIHSKGLKAGIYSEAGHNTCGSQYDNDTLGIGVGLYGHEVQDAMLFFRDWGYDFIKIDYCGAKRLKLDEREQYTRIRQAIDGVGRKDVRINVCRWAFPGTWVSEIGSSWRIFADINPRWSRIRDIIFKNRYMSAYAVRGHFNDMDMLEVSRGLKPEEEQTHFAVWCIMSSPLLIGCDLNKIKPASLELLKNRRLIAINQDRLCRQAELVAEKDSVLLLAKDIKTDRGTERAFAVVNLSDRQQSYEVAMEAQLLLGGKVSLENAVTGEQTTVQTGSLSLQLPPRATRIFTAKAERRLPQIQYEAENAWLNDYQDIRDEKCTHIERGYAVSLGGNIDSWMEWPNVVAQRGGEQKLLIRYRSSKERELTLTVNGKSQTLRCPVAKSGGLVIAKVEMRKGGDNVVRLGNDKAQAPDIDCILVSYAADSDKLGQAWPDDRGIHINAHGGGILYHEGTYYWFGEHKSENTSNALVGVNCYSSQNLEDWTYRGVALSVSDEKGSDIERGCIIERPKVVYNAKTGKFVMWFHLELKDMKYIAARAAVAISDRPEGPYTFIRSERVNAYHYPMNMTEAEIQVLDTLQLRGNKKSEAYRQAVAKGYFLKRDHDMGQMARDQTVYVDDDGKAYHIFASEENYTLHIAELSEDYTFHTGRYQRIAPAGENEAPAIMKRDGKYWMITSGLSGWSPNKARMFSADSIWGPWTQHPTPCVGPNAERTFGGQGTFILKPEGKDEYIFMADIWRPRHPIEASYIWLPISFDADGTPIVEWK